MFFLRYLFAFLIFNLLVGCSIFRLNKYRGMSEAHLTEKLFLPSFQANKTSIEIRNLLTKKESMSGGNYELSLMPITMPYIGALVNETAQQRGLFFKEPRKNENF